MHGPGQSMYSIATTFTSTGTRGYRELDREDRSGEVPTAEEIAEEEQRRESPQPQSKRAIILLRMDWHSSANRALLCGLGAAEARFWVQPRRVICLGGVEVVRRMASRKPREDPMTRTKSNRKTATRSRPVKTAKRKSSKRPVPVGAVSGTLAKDAGWHQERTGRCNAAGSGGNDDRSHHGRNRLATTFCARLPRRGRPQEARPQPGVRTRRKRSRLSHHRRWPRQPKQTE